jgi:hypothetical protein
LNKWKKAISAGMSAALVASLFTFIAATTAFASVTVTSAGTVPRGDTSTGTATFTFTENDANEFSINGTLTVTILDSASGATVTFTGTPVLTAPGSLGASVAVAGNVITVTTTGHDDSNVEQITVSGLKIKATLAAATGAIKATLGGTLSGFVTPATVTATGILQEPLPIAATAGISVNVTSTCNFVTGTSVNFSDVTDARVVTVAGGATLTGVQDIDFAGGTSTHPIGTTVTGTVANCNALTLGSPGTVADVVVQDVPDGAASVQPGEFNQEVANTTITEQTAGYLADNTVLTFALSNALFSNSPIAWVSGGAGLTLAGANQAPCNLSFDRKSCSVTVTDVSTGAAQITLGDANDVGGIGTANADPILVDVPAGTAIGSAVDVTVTGVPAIIVSVDAQTVAYVARVVVGTAAQPTIYIGENDQPSGQISITESGAGFFTDGTGSNNALALCLRTGETFTRAPFAVVTAGDLKLLNGLVGGTSVLGTLYTDALAPGAGNSCARWTVYTASTAASTIEIRGSDSAGAVLASGANNGPRLSVPNSLTPGTTQSDILIGTQAQILNGAGLSSVVSNAVRAFRNTVAVAAVSQPAIARGSIDSLAGNLTITETQAGQLKAGEFVCVEILPHTNSVTTSLISDVFLKTANTNDRPVVSTNSATGLLAGAVSFGCGDTDETDVFTSFGFSVTQQASGTLGVVTISNIHYITTGDAINGPILVRVENQTGFGTDFEAVVSNGKIGNVVAGTASSRLGVTKIGAFTTGTKVQAKGKYVTFRFDFGIAAAGAHFEIWAATKTGNDWSGFSKVTSRVANASGVVYYYIRQNSATWKSYRAYWTGGGVWSPARQARWR